jgi:hypothetical protein
MQWATEASVDLMKSMSFETTELENSGFAAEVRGLSVSMSATFVCRRCPREIIEIQRIKMEKCAFQCCD